MKIQEYLEKKLVEDHGDADEQERPGISAGKAGKRKIKEKVEENTEASPEGTVAHPGNVSPDSVAQDRPTGEQLDRGGDTVESSVRTRVSVKRPAEEEADDSGRGDRSDWRNFIVAGSSSQAPAASTAVAGPGAGQDGSHVISDTVLEEPRGVGTKRPQEDHASMEYDGSEVEVKTQRISAICFGIGSDDITGEINSEDYDEELKEMEAKYEAALREGHCFVHIRAKRSSNKDLKMLSRVTKAYEFKKVNIQGSGVESVITNSAQLASLLERAQDKSREGIEKLLEEEVKGEKWDEQIKGFEQHMAEESSVRVDWQTGKFEEGKLPCHSCGDKNAWDCVHACCQDECKKHINALQAFPLAAWDDISAAPLDPEMVRAARKLEIKYAEQKPVWVKIPRATTKQNGWKIVKSRWIDINKGDDQTPNYRSRMVGKEFNDSVLEGLFAATPPLEALRLLLSHAASRGSPSGVSAGVENR